MRRIGVRGDEVMLLAVVLMLLSHTGVAAPSPGSANTENRNKKISQQNTVVVIGASYAKGWKMSPLAGMQVINKGVGGEQTHEMLARFEKDVIEAAPRAVIIWGHINDIFRSTPEALENKLIRSRENISNMIEKAKHKGITPILVTEITLPAGNSWSDRIGGWIGALRGKQSYQDQVNSHVIEMNQWTRAQAKAKQLTLLDFEKVLADKSGRRKPEFATEDGTHLNTQAYEALTDYVQHLNLGI